MSLLVVIRAEEWLAILLGLLGAVLGFWHARDNRLDLRAYRAMGWNGFAHLAATIGARSGNAKAILHLFLVISSAASLTYTPSSSRYGTVTVFFTALVLGQSVVVRAQILNHRDRNELRRKLT